MPPVFDCFATITGTVTAFDPDRGWGTFCSADNVDYGFHCVAIADGSRNIDVGASVSARIVPGLAGRYEAARIYPVTD